MKKVKSKSLARMQHWGELLKRLWITIILMGALIFNHSTLVLAQVEELPALDYRDGIPDELRTIFDHVGYEHNICPELLEAIAYRESRFFPEVKNGKYYGIMQVNVKVHAQRIEAHGWASEDMLDPEKCITVAADYLLDLFELYGDDDPLILMYYSGNTKAVENYKEYGWTCDYVEDVLDRSAKYERLHEK